MRCVVYVMRRLLCEVTSCDPGLPPIGNAILDEAMCAIADEAACAITAECP